MAKHRSAAGDAEAKFQQAVRAFQKGDFRHAQKIVQRLEKAVGPAPALTHLRGFIDLELGNLPAAIKALKASRSAMPTDVNVVNALGSALRRSGDAAAAVEQFRLAADMAPGRADILANLGNALGAAADRNAAVEAYIRALQINPAMTEVRRNLVTDLLAVGAYARAAAELGRLLAEDPDDTWALLVLAEEDAVNFRYDDARRRYARVLELDPGNADARLGLADMAVASGRPRDAAREYTAVTRSPDGPPGPAASRVMCLNYLPETTPRDLRAAGAEWERRYALRTVNARPRSGHGDAMRVGVLSGKLGWHPCGQFLLPFLAEVDPGRLQVELFAKDVKAHQHVDLLRARAARWHDVSHLPAADTLDLLVSRELDVLISATGFEEGSLLPLFTARPAPVQVVGFAHFGTTGLSSMDAILADRFHIPPGAEDGYAEQVVRLPDSYITYAPPSYLPDLAETRASGARPLTFGCFNALAKLCDETLALWARVLDASPGSRLILKAGPLADEAVRRDLARRFRAAGGDPDRLDLRGGSPHGQLLDTYNEIDLALDPLAYSGGLTTLESLWMGVPVVTLPGETFARRHSLSHLSVSGLDMFVARDADDYLRIATTFPDVMKAAGLDRAGVRGAMKRSPISDGRAYADALADALEGAAAGR